MDIGNSPPGIMKPYLPPLQFLQTPLTDEVGSICELSQFERVTNGKGEKIILRSGTTRAALNAKSREPSASRSALVLIKDAKDESNDCSTQTELEIQSPHMKAALKKCVPTFANFDIEQKPIILHNEPRCVFHYRDALIQYHGECSANGRNDAALHVQFLLDYMYNTLSHDIRHFTNFMENPIIQPALDFLSLWMAFIPGEVIYVSRRAHMHSQLKGCLLRLKSMSRCTCTKPWCPEYAWTLKALTIEFDGEDFGHAHESLRIHQYDGVRALQDLPVMPLKYHADGESIRENLIKRGRKFVEFASQHYVQYDGVAELLSDNRFLTSAGEDDYFPLRSTQINERIVIDGNSFCEARPSHQPYLSSSEKSFRKELGQHLKMSDDEYMICTNTVMGFALTQKRWGLFSLDSIRDIEFNDDAFDSLILKREYKDMILSLVKSHAEQASKFDDVIRGKGKGLIFLLYGDPGTGKTLTAESIADHTKMPLLRLDTVSLGSDMGEVEENLAATFRGAERWNAILLMDEADVFLEERRRADLERNRLVAAFLRALEYFSGIMFLTTNRVTSFDRAFKSRAHLTLHYPKLDSFSRQQIWRNLCTRPGVNIEQGLLDDEEFDSLVSDNLNGRQIKNIVHIASTLAGSQKSQINGEHLKLALAAMNSFEKDISIGIADSADSTEEDGDVEEDSRATRPRKRRRLDWT